MAELVECYLLEVSDPLRGAATYEWLHAEHMASQRQKAERLQMLFAMAQGTQDPEKLEELKRQIIEVQESLKRGG